MRRVAARLPPWELLLALLVQLLVLLPILRTGWLFDDQINSLTAGVWHVEHVSWWHHATRIARVWIDESGRWLPLGFYWGYGQHGIVQGLLLYKWLLVAWALLAACAVYALMRALDAGRAVAALVVVGLAVCTQLRLYYDPHMAFGGLTQGVTIMLAGAMIAYQRWLRGGGWWRLGLALVLLAAAGSTYEAAYLCGILLVLLAVRERRGIRAIASASAGPVALMLAFVVLGAVLRARAHAGAEGPYAPGFGLGELIDTFFDQFSAAIPLTYSLWDPQQVFGSGALGRLGVYDVLVGLAVGAAVFLVILRARWSRWSPLQTGALGLALWVIIAGTLSLAKRYQTELVMGLGHVPVYFEEVGLAMVVVSVAGLAWRRLPEHRRPRLRVALAVAAGAALAVVTMFQHRANEVVVAGTYGAREARHLEDLALHAGLLFGVHDGATAYVQLSSWHYPGYFWLEAHRDLRLVYPEQVSEGRRPAASKKRCALAGGEGDVVFASAQSATDIYAGLAAAGCAGTGRDSRVFLRNLDPQRDWLTGRSQTGSAVSRPVSDLLRPLGGGLWTARDDAVDVTTLTVGEPVSRPELAPTTGCWDEGGAERWCGTRGDFPIYGPPGTRAVLTLTVVAARPEARLTVAGDGARRRVAAAPGTTVVVPVRFSALGGATVRFGYDGPRWPSPGDARKLYIRLAAQIAPG